MTYEWKRQDNSSLPSSAQSSLSRVGQGIGHKLVINNVHNVNNGWYCCVAINEHNTTEDCAWLEVNGTFHNGFCILKLCSYLHRNKHHFTANI